MVDLGLLRRHEDRMRRMVADPTLTGDLFCLAYVIARRLDFDEHADEGLDVIALQVLGGTEKAMEWGMAVYLRELLVDDDDEGALRRHLPEVDWPSLYRWADPDRSWGGRPRLALIEGAGA